MTRSLAILVVLLGACGGAPGPDTAGISAENVAAHVRFLADDLFEGRGVATRGEDLTVRYLATQLALAGARPAAPDGSYYQRVPLVEVRSQHGSALWLGDRQLVPREEYVAGNERQTGREVLDAEIVYVGHGIVAPEFDWDDYKGTDVTGKVVLLFTNEPPSEDESFFGGAALTYYGRWTFKYEEAARRGASGVLIIHTDETAGYPWGVVRNSWSGGQLFVEAGPEDARLAMAGWITSEAAASVLASLEATAGKSLDELLDMAHDRDFRPFPLGLRARADLRNSIVPVETVNVLGAFEGSDPELREQAVLYTAHWDHLGVGEESEAEEDTIYNGAVDNATGCAVLLEIARVLGGLDSRPARSVLFAFVGAEESGLLGSAYYASNPVVPMGQTAVNLNYDGLFPFGRTSDFSLPGHERTTLRPLVEQMAAEAGISLTPDPHPEQGYYYRSDQFSLAKHGVPAFSLRTGSHFVGQAQAWGDEQMRAYRARSYHQPSDEFQEEWDFRGIAELAQFGLELGLEVAAQAELPTWREGDEFLAARETSWQ